MRNRYRVRFLYCLPVLLLLAGLQGCEEDPDEARFKLGQLGYQFNAFSLYVATRANDHVAVDYLILAGMNPNTVIDAAVVNEERMRTGTELLEETMGRSSFLREHGFVRRQDWHYPILNLAVYLQHTETMEVLLKAGADPNLPDAYGATALMRAAQVGNEDVVEELLDADAEQVEDEDGNTPLSLAIANDDLVLIELLIDEGGDLTVTNNVGLSVLAQAVLSASVETVSMLIDAGVEVNLYNPEVERGDGLTPLMVAVKEGRLDMVRLLLEAGADPNLRSATGDTAITLASAKTDPSDDDVAILLALLEAGADPRIENDEGETALAAALLRIPRSANAVRVVRALLDAGSDPNRLLKGDIPPISWIVFSLRGKDQTHYGMQVLEALIDAGADAGVPGEGEPPLFTVIERAGYGTESESQTLPLVQLLLDAGADPNVHDRAGETVLSVAADRKWATVIEALLGAGADPDLANAQSETLLFNLSWGSNIDLVETLLEAGADPDLADDEGVTPLMQAAEASRPPNVDIAKALLEAGADADLADDEGVTALMRAAESPRAAKLDMVRVLLEGGADPHLQDNRGRTAVNFVRFGTMKRQQVLAALQEALEQEREPVAVATPAPLQPEPGPTTQQPVGDGAPEPVNLAELRHETYVGGMKRRRMKIYGLSGDGNWCASNVVLKVVAPSASVYSDGTFNFFMKRFGERINEAQFCPAARAAQLVGYTETGSEPVFTGTASAEGGWAVD